MILFNIIAFKLIKDKADYREWDLIPRITIVFEKKDFLGICIGWLIYGVVIAIKPSLIKKLTTKTNNK